MNYFFVDYENVHMEGFGGAQQLKKGDRVCVLYTEQSKNFSLDILHQIRKQKAVFEVCKVNSGSKNALDFQLASYLGYCIAKNEDQQDVQYFIISNDTGYDRLVEFWGERNIIVRRAANFIEVEFVINPSQKALVQDIAAPDTDNRSSVMQSKVVTKEDLLQYLTKEEYSDRILEIVNTNKSRVAINNALSKELRNNNKCGVIYQKLKALLLQKGRI